MAGQALTAVLVALLVTVCLIGLWATYALRSAYDREAQHRTRAEVQLTAHRLAARFTAGQSITEPLTPDWLPSGLTMAVGIYDHLGQRCTVVTNDLTGELTLPDNLDVAGADREESRYVHGVWALTVPLRKADGERLGHLRLLARHRQAQLSGVVLRVAYELPLWLVVGAAGLWLMRSVFLSGRSAARSYAKPPASVEFVMAGYQEVIDHLQSAGRELERLRTDAEHRALVQAQFSDRLIASIPDALVVVDEHGMTVLANLTAQRLFGRPPGIPFREFFADVPELQNLVAAGLQDGSVRRQSDITALIGGHQRTLEASVAPIPGAASVLCLIANITELAALRATAQARETMTSLGDMAAGIAHEFKNSLATMDGYARLLLQDVPDNPAARALRDEVRHLTQVVSDFLTFARPLRPVMAPVDLAGVVEEVVTLLGEDFRRQAMTLVLPDSLPVIPGDAALLRRVFENLFRNALEAIPDDAPVREVRLRAITGPEDVTLLVEDSGTGFPPEVAANLFLPFFTTKKQGHGLGLAIVRKIIVSHNGRIEACNLPAGGAQFRISLPLRIGVEK
ncbi:PAS domain-containing sensor histidine kinase [Chloracidobacterium aggregatum]|uniref:histidine kinase n=1 Tax=Chloracidobacterium sp. N TaxID=2821540 RepID=A0ABX8AXH8_9BACT|nr:ATP-binding protein [Chloracidobacterium aggregatum]QUV84230.1 GHKL domain-containing protein [Chloracidobacterium sp. 2]QUV87283.1 GHKL domain-containing protein [Chloracidobacterium sp. S]QUV90188.1 GHKL domain-containing protein [Chloracidobacterium sp. A]QUV93398.1 GHKL domain-containing protein [Chloracidobacterium sp. N]QUV96555.1 GHKL domain-containing protein [Chloracidobacterium sp. E]